MSINKTNEEILAIIRKDLPAQVGETLQLRLAEADKMELDIQALRVKVLDAEATIKVQSDTISKLNALKLTADGLANREELVAKRERAAEVEALKVQLQAEKEKSQFIMDVTKALVRNIEYRESVFEGKNYPQPGGIMLYGSDSKTSTKTVE